MTNTKTKEAVLFFMPVWSGFHLAGWREENAPHDPQMNFKAIRQMVQTAERGKFHGCFIADSLEIRPFSRPALSRTSKSAHYEPLTLLSALSGCTEHIGLLATASTTYSDPFNLARMFASLDHLSGGRSGWNLVTSASEHEAANFGREQHMDHSLRYERAQEFYDIATGLWDSWEDDAFVFDKESGIFCDPDKLHAINYRGEHLSAAGPLNIPRPLQGHPVIAQAGSSAEGRAFAARVADVIYTFQPNAAKGKEFYDEIKEQVAQNGRTPDHVKILPALILVVGRSQADADEKLARLDELLEPEVGIEQLTEYIDTDLSGAPLDGPVPDIPTTDRGSRGRQKFFLDLAKRDNLTIRQLMQVVGRGMAVAGTATTLADMVQEWVEAGASDGFNISFAGGSADSLDVFVDEVIPELQRRGLFHTDYRGTTLRENLGIPRPLNRFATVPR